MKYDCVEKYLAVTAEEFLKVGYRFGGDSDVGYFPGLELGKRVSVAAAFERRGGRAVCAGGGLHNPGAIDRTGIVVLGRPFGSEGFKEQCVETTVDKAVATMDKIEQAVLEPVLKAKLIQDGMINKLGYLCQAVDPSITVPEMKRFDRKVKKGIVGIIGRRMNWKQVLQSQLPVKDGGMGFRSLAAAASLLYHVTQVKIAQAYLSDYPALVPQQILEINKLVQEKDRLGNDGSYLNQEGHVGAPTLKSCSESQRVKVLEYLLERMSLGDERRLSLGTLPGSGDFIKGTMLETDLSVFAGSRSRHILQY